MSRLRYVEKDSTSIEREREKERVVEKEKERERGASSVVMLLSDGCIEDITSMLFTTVVPNLSMIVGHNIDGLPLTPTPSRRHSLVTKIRGALDPLIFGILGGTGEDSHMT